MMKTNDINCLLCDNNDYKLLFEAKDRLHGVDGMFTYVRCKNCGLVYMNPQIASDELAKFYPNIYAPHNIVKKTQEIENKHLTNQLIVSIKAFFFEHQNINKIPSFVLDILNPDSKVLDVGCGNGTFLNDIKNKVGCQVHGVDISKTAVLSAKEHYDLEIIKGIVEEISFPSDSFDLITAWWSLVHINNPNEMLQKLSTLLKTDGYCILGVPNFNSFNARFFKDKWMHLDAPRHLCIHTPSTTKKILEQNGFSVKKIIYDRNPSGLFGSLQYHRYGSNTANEKIQIPPFLVKTLFVFIALTALFKASDLLVVCAQKNTA